MRTANDALNVMRSWIGKNERDGSHKEIIDIYNSHRPLAVNYKVKYTDSWCDATISAVAIKTGMVDLIGTECSCERHIKIWKKMGIWNEDGSITPIAGDIILFNWDDKTQENNGWADHVGFVEKVEGNIIYTLEGNTGDAVRQKTYRVGDGRIRGYARPKYESIIDSNIKPSKSTIEIAKEVIDGKWGNGADREKRITEAGYNYSEVRKQVNIILNHIKPSDSSIQEKPNIEQNKPIENYNYEKFIREVQSAIGAKVDGIKGPETLSKTITVSATHNHKHLVVKPIQKYLYALGYVEIGKADGIAGEKFTTAVKHFQKDNSCYIDGIITAKNKTWRKLLKMNEVENKKPVDNKSTFIKEVQMAIGANPDGIYGPETLSKTPTISSKKNHKHPVVKIIQRKMNELGYNVGVADGIAGEKFKKGVFAYQKDHGCYPDGEITGGKKTWVKLLTT